MNIKQKAEYMLKVLKDKSADSAFAHITYIRNHTLTFANGSINSLSVSEHEKTHIKARHNGNCIEKNCICGDKNTMDKILQDIADALANASDNSGNSDNCIEPCSQNRYTNSLTGKYDINKMKEFMLVMKEKTEQMGAKLERSELTYQKKNETLRSMPYNSEITDTSDGFIFSFSASVCRNGKTIVPINRRFAFKSLNDYSFQTELALCKYYPMLFEPVKLKTPFAGTWILEPRATYYLLMDHLFCQLYGDSIIMGKSKWKDRFGELVMHKSISVYMDPFAPSVTLGERITSDGLPAYPYTLIENGILRNAITDCQTARRLGIEPSKNGGDNLVVSGTNKPLKEIFAGIQNGILSRAFIGKVTAAGDFSGMCRQNFLIRNGSIVCSIDDVSVSGNLIDILSGEKFLFSSETEADGESIVPYFCVSDMNFK